MHNGHSEPGNIAHTARRFLANRIDLYNSYGAQLDDLDSSKSIWSMAQTRRPPRYHQQETVHTGTGDLINTATAFELSRASELSIDEWFQPIALHMEVRFARDPELLAEEESHQPLELRYFITYKEGDQGLPYYILNPANTQGLPYHPIPERIQNSILLREGRMHLAPIFYDYEVHLDADPEIEISTNYGIPAPTALYQSFSLDLTSFKPMQVTGALGFCKNQNFELITQIVVPKGHNTAQNLDTTRYSFEVSFVYKHLSS